MNNKISRHQKTAIYNRSSVKGRTPEANLIEGIKTSLAQYHSEILSERIERGLERSKYAR